MLVRCLAVAGRHSRVAAAPLPLLRDLPSHAKRRDSGRILIDLEKRRCLDGCLDRCLGAAARADSCFEMAVRVRLRVSVEGRREYPAIVTHVQEPVVLPVIVVFADQDPFLQFGKSTQKMLGAAAVCTQRVHDVGLEAGLALGLFKCWRLAKGAAFQVVCRVFPH